jgi:serine protease AprX
MRSLRLLPTLLIVGLMAATPASAQRLGPVAAAPATLKASTASTSTGSSLDRALQNTKAGERPRVIVRYRNGAERRLLKRLQDHGDVLRQRHRQIGALSFKIHGADIQRLLHDADVVGISEDAPVEAEQLSGFGGLGTILTPPPQTDAQNLRRTLGLTDNNTGAGVGVANIDSGIAREADVASRVVGFYDFTNGAGGVAAPMSDGYGHGTHIAGLIAGSGAQSNGRYVGVAPNVRLIGLKVLDAKGQGYSSDVISAVEFAIANKNTLGIDVINMSLGHPILEAAATDPLVIAVERAVDAGIVVVVSAGNRGLNPLTGEIGFAGITSPGNAPSALTVGSLRTKATTTRDDDEVSPFSSRGPTWYDGLVKPDILAPGQALVAIGDQSSTLSQNLLLRADVTPYLRLSGTSMAAAVASGVVADVIQAHRASHGATAHLTPNTIKAMLQFTSIDVPGSSLLGASKELSEGAGAVNAAGAIQLAQLLDPTAAVGTPWISGGVIPETTIGATTYAWTAHIIWGDNIIWGDSIFWNEPGWAEHIIWGDSTDDHVIWGDSLLPDVSSLTLDSAGIWDTHVVWGDGLVQSLSDGHVLWGDVDDSHVIWGDSTDGHVVWGDSLF